jgi:hypothetical protein
VGNLLIAVANPSPLFCDAPFLFQFPQTVSVGSNAPPAISFMARADMSGCKRSVSPGISSLHESLDKFPSAFCPDSRRVFEEDDGRLNNVNCSEQLPYKPRSFAIDSVACASTRNILTRESRCDAIHFSFPWLWIEPPDVCTFDMDFREPTRFFDDPASSFVNFECKY